MEGALKRALGTAVLRPTGHSGGGCISQGRSYDTDPGLVFVKSSCTGEVWRGQKNVPGRNIKFGSLKTQAVRAPKPIKVVELPGDNTVLMMEHL